MGDETRTWGPPFVEGTASYFLGVNRNKQDIVLDLSRPEGREAVLRLLADADVLVENFKTGTMEKWGLGFEEVLRERFPRLIHCRVSGFGGDGPLGGAPGYDAVAQAMGGLMSVNGDPASGPTRIGIPIVDMTTGLNAVIGILLALAERQRSGQGQFVEATLFDTAVGLLHPHAANWFVNGQVPVLAGSGHPNVVPYDKFETRSGEVFLGIGNDGQFRKFCAFVGAPELATDPRYASNGERNRNRIALRASIETLLADRDAAELCEGLLKAGIPAGPVNQLPQVLQHPHTLHREMVVEFDNGQRGLGIPVKLSRTPGSVHAAAPTLGQHTREVLLGLGYSSTEVDAMIEQGIARAP
jgi:formyl-CoA transferase